MIDREFANLEVGAPDIDRGGGKRGGAPYQRIMAQIVDQIHAGTLRVGDKLEPIRKLATHYDVSLTTVLRSVRTLTHEGVLDSFPGKGVYVARPPARTIGILLARAESEMVRVKASYGSFLAVVQEKLVEGGFDVLTMQACELTREGAKFVSMGEIATQQLRAVILADILDFEYIAQLRQAGLTVIASDVDAVDLGAHSVFFDNIGSSFQLTNKLISRGHRDILFVGGARKKGNSTDLGYYDMAVHHREDGFRLAMENAGLNPKTVVYTEWKRSDEDFHAAVLAAHAQGLKFTAVLAEGVSGVELGLAELGLAGMDVAGWVSATAETADAPLTGSRVAIAQCDFREIGVHAADILSRITADDTLPIQRIIVKPTIVSR